MTVKATRAPQVLNEQLAVDLAPADLLATATPTLTKAFTRTTL